ncbi:MAG: acyltransferase [Burkholderiales bacterium]|nr:acyltransferase [Burkholderiales bacterium]
MDDITQLAVADRINTNRIHGLDTLRATAIILVYIYHLGFVAHKPVFDIGWVGVDLFFVLSGYLIGNQIFTDIAHKRNFSIKIFIMRRLFRTVPNYLLVLILYLFVTGFRDQPTLPPLWKLLTFTSNFGLKTGTAFSHAWSLCIEEQFYLALPIIAVFVYYKKSLKLAWYLIAFTLISGMALRAYMWVTYTDGMSQNPDLFNYKSYYMYIYYFTLCRLDPIICGVIIAIVRNFYSQYWYKITSRGNLCLTLGIISLSVTCYIFMNHGYIYQYSLTPTIIGFPMLGISFGLLVISALSPNSILHKTKVPFAKTIAILSFAIYLIQKPLDHLTASTLIKYNLVSNANTIMFICTALVSILGGWLLYTFIETPFLKLRDKLYSKPKL